jgi:hypothetical protein
MPLAGFSENDVPLAIGYHLGLRWFQAKLPNHDHWEVQQFPGGGMTATCGCGDATHVESVSELPGWWDGHTATAPGVVLRGAYGQWVPGINQAVCEASNIHPAPARHCSCGFWAYWRLGKQQAAAPHVAGLIKGTGRMIRGPEGFRCAKAEIVALVVPSSGPVEVTPYGSADRVYVPGSEDDYLALALEQVYKVPVYGSIEALLEKHKAPDGQPALGDDWFRKVRGIEPLYNTGGMVSSGSFSFTVPPNSLLMFGNSGSANVSAGGGGAGGVSAAFRAGAQPCCQCHRTNCAPNQNLCAGCQLGQVSAKLASLEAGAKKMGQAAITGKEALDQLAARKAAWDDTPDPQAGTIRWVADYIQRKFGREGRS